MRPREAAIKLARARIERAMSLQGAGRRDHARMSISERWTKTIGSTWWQTQWQTKLSPVIARFDVRRRGYLAPDGTAAVELPGFAADPATLVSLYRAMVLTRTFDLKAVSLQRTGRLGTYAVSLGQEAVSVGIASAMRAGGRAAAVLSRQRHAALARGQDGGDPALLGRGRARQSLLGSGARLPVLRSRRLTGAARCRRRLCLQVPQTSRALPFACWAMAPPPRAMSTRR